MKLYNELCPLPCELPSEYTSQKIKDKIARLMASDVKERNMCKIRSNKFFRVSADETANKLNNSVFCIVY